MLRYITYLADPPNAYGSHVSANQNIFAVDGSKLSAITYTYDRHRCEFTTLPDRPWRAKAKDDACAATAELTQCPRDLPDACTVSKAAFSLNPPMRSLMSLEAWFRLRLIFPCGSLMLWGIDRKLTSTNTIPTGSIMSACFGAVWYQDHPTMDTPTNAPALTFAVFCPEHDRLEQYKMSYIQSLFKLSLGMFTYSAMIPLAFVTPEVMVNEEQAHVLDTVRRDSDHQYSIFRAVMSHGCEHDCIQPDHAIHESRAANAERYIYHVLARKDPTVVCDGDVMCPPAKLSGRPCNLIAPRRNISSIRHATQRAAQASVDSGKARLLPIPWLQ
ncbi:hypothetical protein TI39_contig4278g00009 [Zymoseptoria brevis]|uniref:Uncharacterized protein n=1 Tax=Zymoseptoria brevis TaxID=1047168 RepID=A0A0F4G8D5_9PEZI|nr:hypothetical protein TI39_contig4278g00009 [Zymoseptoria brevis]